MPNLLPSGTTWLDLATLGVALVALLLTLLRDRRQTLRRLSLAVSRVRPSDPNDHTLAVVLTNTGAQPLSVTGAGFAERKGGELLHFAGWRDRNFRRTGSEMWQSASDPAFPEPLKVGDVPYAATLDIRAIKTQFFGKDLAWAWAVDEQGKVWWCEIPADVRVAIRTSNRFATGPDDEYGGPTQIEVNDAGERVSPR